MFDPISNSIPKLFITRMMFGARASDSSENIFSKVPVLKGATYENEGPTKSKLLIPFTYVVVVEVVVVGKTHSQSRMT